MVFTSRCIYICQELYICILAQPPSLDSILTAFPPYKPEQEKMTKQDACKQTLDLNFMILYFGEMLSLNSLKTLIIVTGVSVSLPVDRSISSKTQVRFYKLTKTPADMTIRWTLLCYYESCVYF